MINSSNTWSQRIVTWRSWIENVQIRIIQAAFRILHPRKQVNQTTTSHTKGVNQIMKKAILVAIIGVFAISANAGDWGKAPVPAKAPIEECLDIGGEISSGYMSDYIFYGVRFARDSVWTDVNYTFDNLIIPVNVGVWYLNGIDPVDYDELDIYASVELGSFAGFDASLGYVHYFFPETGADSNGEIGLDLSRSLGIVDVALETNYNLWLEGWYHQVGIEKTFGISDNVSLVVGAGLGYSDNYFAGANNSGWNHYYVSAALPIELNCRATLTPYVGYNGGPGGYVVDGFSGIENGDDQSDILHGGVSLSVSF